jgi:putative ABC transport system ATP-binding protein
MAEVAASAPPSLLRLHGLRLVRGAGDNAFELQVPEFAVARGELLAVTGRSGSGKSTLLEVLGLILHPQSSGGFTLCLDGIVHDLMALWQRNAQDALAALRARAFGFVLQTGGLLPFLSVRDNIALPRRLLGLPLDDELVRELPQALGIAALLGKMPAELSIGERQRVAIARALAHHPELLLADEPTAALDPEHAQRVFELLIRLVQRFGMSAIVVTHDWDLVQQMGLREVRGTPVPAACGAASCFAAVV